MNAPRSATGARIAFFIYALIIATLTHWPQLQMPEMGLTRSDLVVHIGVFGLWTILFIRCAWFGPAASARNIALGGLCSLVYAGLDEATQGLPGIRRFVGWDDFSANMLGVATGVTTVLILAAFDPPAAPRR